MKRLWLETEQAEQADWALTLYQEALNAAKTPDQIYYLAINVAFMKLTFANDISSAQSMAKVAAGDDWRHRIESLISESASSREATCLACRATDLRTSSRSGAGRLSIGVFVSCAA